MKSPAPAIGLARLQLRRFTRGPLPRAALAVLILIPLLYGALYLWAFWDPYGRLDQVPVALVNEDRPAVTSDGRTVSEGKALADELIDRQVFGWQLTDPDDAERGLRDGGYLMVLTIPRDFSGSLVSPDRTAPTGSDPSGLPRSGVLSVETNDANNYLTTTIARSAFTEIRTAAAGDATRGYFDAMFIGFSEIHDATADAAHGAGELAGGARDAHEGAGSLASGTKKAKRGSAALADGLGSASHGAHDLAEGLAALEAGSDELADGTARAAAGTRRLADKVDAAADVVEPYLRTHSDDIGAAADELADGAQLLSDNLEELPELADSAVDRTAAARRALDEYAQAHPEAADDPAYQRAVKATGDAHDAAVKVQKILAANKEQFAALQDRAAKLAEAARAVQRAAPHLADDVAAARHQVDALADGMDRLAAGADRLHDGTRTAHSGAVRLDRGLYRLATGARQLDAGLARLSAGTSRLADGLGQLDSGATRLANGLAEGADRIPDYGADERARRSGMMADPIELRRHTENAARTYGEGFAPYFVGLALWVGAMITYMLFQPLTARHLASNAPAWRVALAGWLPAVLLGLLQAAILVTVLRLTLGLDPARPLGVLGFLAVTVAAFTAVVQWLGARLGAAGRLVALALLMLQLVSAGGTFPIETSPGFLRWLHPYLPMTYVVGGLRHLISGGPVTSVWLGCAVLAGIAGGALALTTLAAGKGRRLTPAKLHPDLVMS